ncbi:hypothetical protein EVAR_56595_1 [Eumeta japonica]|uniref:Uncharacterized protein n=1 Tax=Eumeta variegata TaxID=151549 RepID=A0A4C1Z2X2_EUMVA|nr:hypothetical protein EVAR_56595_1 [Eumeta japonica]
MEATGWDMRERSVRPGLYSRENAAQPESSVFAAPRGPVSSAVPHSTDNVTDYSAVPTVVVKTERDAEHSVTSQVHHTRSARHKEDSKTNDGVVVKQQFPEDVSPGWHETREYNPEHVYQSRDYGIFYAYSRDPGIVPGLDYVISNWVKMKKTW